jgi:hypothetical protein
MRWRAKVLLQSMRDSEHQCRGWHTGKVVVEGPARELNIEAYVYC